MYKLGQQGIDLIYHKRLDLLKELRVRSISKGKYCKE